MQSKCHSIPSKQYPTAHQSLGVPLLTHPVYYFYRCEFFCNLGDFQSEEVQEVEQSRHCYFQGSE